MDRARPTLTADTWSSRQDPNRAVATPEQALGRDRVEAKPDADGPGCVPVGLRSVRCGLRRLVVC